MAYSQYQKRCSNLRGGEPMRDGGCLQNDKQGKWGCVPQEEEGKDGPVEQAKLDPGVSGVPGEHSRVFEQEGIRPCIGGQCASREQFDEPPMFVSDDGLSEDRELHRQLHGGKSVSNVTSFNYRKMWAK